MIDEPAHSSAMNSTEHVCQATAMKGLMHRLTASQDVFLETQSKKLRAVEAIDRGSMMDGPLNAN